MGRRNFTREDHIASVTAAWNAIKPADKGELMAAHPDLYFACAWLAAHETVRNL